MPARLPEMSNDVAHTNTRANTHPPCLGLSTGAQRSSLTLHPPERGREHGGMERLWYAERRGKGWNRVAAGEVGEKEGEREREEESLNDVWWKHWTESVSKCREKDEWCNGLWGFRSVKDEERVVWTLQSHKTHTCFLWSFFITPPYQTFPYFCLWVSSLPVQRNINYSPWALVVIQKLIICMWPLLE